MTDTCFIAFKNKKLDDLIPEQLNNPFDLVVPDICKVAAAELQLFITKNQHLWAHNFGFCNDKVVAVKGKMFGVLVVRNKAGELGYLSTFSGKIQDNPHPTIFVPSLFDISANDYFINKGMSELTQIGEQIQLLVSENTDSSLQQIALLKEERKQKSIHLQQELFDQYQFLNSAGNVKSLCAIFEKYAGRNPAAGAGECAAPKLLQYAFKHHMEPLAIAEFWWGKSTKSEDKQHKEFYPACNDKCRPILSYMLDQNF